MMQLSKYQFVLFSILYLFLFPQKITAENVVRINEVLIHPSAGNKEWVEIFNPEQVDVIGYWIDDDDNFENDVGSSSKKSLATIVLGNDAHYASIEVSAIFNNAADRVVLFDTTGILIDQYEYTKDPGVDKSIGRSPDGTGSFDVLSQMTKGERNADPLPEPTATSLPTQKPTKAPTPTKVPTATKNPTATKIPTATKGPTSTQTKLGTATKAPTKSSATKKTIPVTRTASMSGVPTSILGIRTMKNSPTPKNKRVLTKDLATSQPPYHAIFISAGGVLFTVCAILIYRKIRRTKDE